VEFLEIPEGAKHIRHRNDFILRRDQSEGRTLPDRAKEEDAKKKGWWQFWK